VTAHVTTVHVLERISTRYTSILRATGDPRPRGEQCEHDMVDFRRRIGER
jgi:hypothetical protein